MGNKDLILTIGVRFKFLDGRNKFTYETVGVDKENKTIDVLVIQVNRIKKYLYSDVKIFDAIFILGECLIVGFEYLEFEILSVEKTEMTLQYIEELKID
jgi:hypothetical protein